MRLIFFIVILLPQFVSGQAAHGINTKEAIDIGGIRQWIYVNGSLTTHPVLLFLHGGPGNSAMGYADKFSSELQKHFVVVHWDQRESGKTAELNTSDKPMSVSLLEDDAVEVINHLRKRFSKDRIFLMGHSWGGFLALKIARDHPGLLTACLAVSPMVNQLESERLSLQWMMEKAKKENNQEAITELNTASPSGSGSSTDPRRPRAPITTITLQA